MQTTLFLTCLVLAILVGILSGIIATYFFLLRRKDQAIFVGSKIQSHQSSETPQKPLVSIETTPTEQSVLNPKSEDQELMTVETRVKIIQNLEKFEESGLFTNRNLSLPYLAAHLETNTKYLSKIIKNYKNSDFNAYINKLRIDFILRQLNENKEFRHYKISSLAEEAGYSSHSKFATIFKQIVGIPPSLYIQHLEIGKIPRDIPNMSFESEIMLS
ncbi:helix-turn-helix transcriptional regulator [Soonwooa sp.]|uniref:helix-turn-helix domain-containing protein n=1 Tax=Soonwooa sp. TaxID=1938592 RepID=UPI0026329F29|nr:helix-turn-helix transcriptional regulator [Soonwooa sp.]